MAAPGIGWTNYISRKWRTSDDLARLLRNGPVDDRIYQRAFDQYSRNLRANYGGGQPSRQAPVNWMGRLDSAFRSGIQRMNLGGINPGPSMNLQGALAAKNQQIIQQQAPGLIALADKVRAFKPPVPTTPGTSATGVTPPITAPSNKRLEQGKGLNRLIRSAAGTGQYGDVKNYVQSMNQAGWSGSEYRDKAIGTLMNTPYYQNQFNSIWSGLGASDPASRQQLLNKLFAQYFPNV